jgi:hypothetical protein
MVDIFVMKLIPVIETEVINIITSLKGKMLQGMMIFLKNLKTLCKYHKQAL